MTTTDWVGALCGGLTAVLVIVMALRRTIESLVGKRLDIMQEGITSLNAKSDNHGNRITRVETILEVNGCLAEPCDRRKDPRP